MDTSGPVANGIGQGAAKSGADMPNRHRRDRTRRTTARKSFPVLWPACLDEPGHGALDLDGSQSGQRDLTESRDQVGADVLLTLSPRRRADAGSLAFEPFGEVLGDGASSRRSDGPEPQLAPEFVELVASALRCRGSNDPTVPGPVVVGPGHRTTPALGRFVNGSFATRSVAFLPGGTGYCHGNFPSQIAQHGRRFALRGRCLPAGDHILLLPVLLPVPDRVPRSGAQNGDFTREFLAERVRFELTGLSSSGFQDRRIRPLCHLSGVRTDSLPRTTARSLTPPRPVALVPTTVGPAPPPAEPTRPLPRRRCRGRR